MLEQDIKELTTAVNALTAALKAQSALPTTVGTSAPQTDIAPAPEAPKPAEPKAEKPKAKADTTPAEPKPEPAAKIEEAPSEEAPASHNLTQDDMKEYIKKAFTKCGGAPITSALQAFGKGKLPDVPVEDYPKLLQHLKDACPELEV